MQEEYKAKKAVHAITDQVRVQIEEGVKEFVNSVKKVIHGIRYEAVHL